MCTYRMYVRLTESESESEVGLGWVGSKYLEPKKEKKGLNASLHRSRNEIGGESRYNFTW